MELLKLPLLIVCSAVLILLVLPAITMFFIFQAKEQTKFPRWAKVAVIICIIFAVFLLGVIAWNTVVLLRPADPLSSTPEPSTETTVANPETTTPIAETVPDKTEPILPLATISDNELEGVWIAAAEPYIPEDENYTLMTKAGYYQFDLNGNFTYTQLLMAKTNVWAQQEECFQCSGTYMLDGDVLMLRYTASSEESTDLQPVDYTEEVSMLVDRTCTDMCVRTPDHPKLGQLMFFRKGRADDPVNSIIIILNCE